MMRRLILALALLCLAGPARADWQVSTTWTRA